MNVLAIETSTEAAEVGLVVENTFFTKKIMGVQHHAAQLLSMIDMLFAEAHMRPMALDGIVFGMGPGSFTGLRVACSVAKGLAYGLDKPLYPVGSLDAIIHATRQRGLCGDMPVLAMLDARMGQVYWCWQYAGQQSEVQVSFPEEIRNLPNIPTGIAGVGWEPYITRLPGFHCIAEADRHIVYPDAQSLLRIVLAGDIAPVSAALAEPFYVRNTVVS